MKVLAFRVNQLFAEGIEFDSIEVAAENLRGAEYELRDEESFKVVARISPIFGIRSEALSHG